MEGRRGVTRLPQPALTGEYPLEQMLARRRSIRQFAGAPISPGELSQLLWATQGVTGPEGSRTAPSAGALYPLEVYAVTAAGVAHYEPGAHALVPVRSDDVRPQLCAGAFHQESVLRAPLVIVIAAALSRSDWKYGTRALRYVHMEAGHAAQNLLLQAVALGLGAVPIGAFHDQDVRVAVGLPASQAPLYLIPLGRPAEDR